MFMITYKNTDIGQKYSSTSTFPIPYISFENKIKFSKNYTEVMFCLILCNLNILSIHNLNAKVN